MPTPRTSCTMEDRTPTISPRAFSTALPAFAACALNEAQEHKFDALMVRTRRRPIPSGKISPLGATLWAVVLAAVALAGLGWLGGWLAVALGTLAVLWYNGIYTYLKRRSLVAYAQVAHRTSVATRCGCSMAKRAAKTPPIDCATK